MIFLPKSCQRPKVCFDLIFKNELSIANYLVFHEIALPEKSVFRDEYSNEGRRSMQSQLRSLTAYDRHKLLINEYFLSFPGATKLLQRDK